MDILAHGLWAAAGVGLARRHRRVTPPDAVLAVTLAVLPDLLPLLPIAAWWLFGDGPLAALWSYAVAVPGGEPCMPPMVQLLSHHLHCIAHSALVAGVVTAALWAWKRTLWLPLLGWWSHIVIDVFTHSADFYPAPVLYPITQRGFDGLAWNTPWFLVANYLALALVGAWWLRGRRGA